MKKNQIFAVNVQKVLEYSECEIEKAGRIQMNNIFSNPKFKKLSKKIPKDYADKEAINKFYQETGLVVQYCVFSDQFSFLEYDRMGVHPDNDKWMMVGNGEMSIEEFKSHPEYMETVEDADIQVIMKGVNYRHLYYVQSNAFKTLKAKFFTQAV